MKNLKTTSTILLITSLLSAVALWGTRLEFLPSLSAFALSDNVLFYRLMHLTASWFFMLNVARTKHNLFLGFGMGLILAFDMYHYELIHNVITALTLGFACFSIIYNSKGFERNIMAFASGSAILIFCIGYFTNAHHLLAEIIAMSIIMVAKLRELKIIKR